MINTNYLYELLQNAGIPITTVTNTNNTKEGIVIHYAPEATQQHIDAGNAILADFDINALTPDETVEANAKTKYDDWKPHLADLSDAILARLNGFAPEQIASRVSATVTRYTNWTFGGAAPVRADIDALFVGIIGLTIAMIYLLRKQRL